MNFLRETRVVPIADTPEGLAVAIERAVVRERKDRWQDAVQMKEALSVGVA